MQRNKKKKYEVIDYACLMALSLLTAVGGEPDFIISLSQLTSCHLNVMILNACSIYESFTMVTSHIFLLLQPALRKRKK
jgi:hypothetical protein